MPFEDRSLGDRLTCGRRHDIDYLLRRGACGHRFSTLARRVRVTYTRARLALALLAKELVAAEERPDAAEHGDCDGQPQRDDPQPRGGQAGDRHEDPQQAVREAEHERQRLRAAGCERADQERRVDARVRERDPLQARERQRTGAGAPRRRAQRRASDGPARARRCSLRQPPSHPRQHLARLGRPLVDLARPPGVLVVLGVRSHGVLVRPARSTPGRRT